MQAIKLEAPIGTGAIEQSLKPCINPSTTEIFLEIKNRICMVSQPERIIVFGSYARNEQGKDSDIDLLVIMTVVESIRHESIRFRRALRGLRIPVDVLVATLNQIERHRHTLGLIYATALREGIVIYERSVTC